MNTCIGCIHRYGSVGQWKYMYLFYSRIETAVVIGITENHIKNTRCIVLVLRIGVRRGITVAEIPLPGGQSGCSGLCKINRFITANGIPGAYHEIFVNFRADSQIGYNHTVATVNCL